MAGPPGGPFAGLAPPLSPDELRRWRAVGDKLRTEQLPRSRAVAEKWAATLATLVSVTSVLGFLAKRDDLLRLPLWAQWACAVALLGALLLAAAAAYWGADAAFGALQPVATDPASLRDYYASESNRIADILGRLRLMAGVALLLVVGVILVLVFLPIDARPVRAVVVTRDGAVLCGTLSTVAGVAHLTASATGEARPIEGAVQVTVVTACN